MQKKIVIFEVEGGSDKWINGLRRDTMPILRAIENEGWLCEILYFRDEWKDEIYEYSKENFSGFISRINPGNLPNGELLYFETLRRLSDSGLVAMSHPDEMQLLGSKDILLKLRNTSFTTSDTFGYSSICQFKKQFPFSLSQNSRVIKQNRGSTGAGIWKVEINDDTNCYEGEPLPLDTLIKCTEASDNHSEIHTLEKFMEFCEKYMIKDQNILIDMPYLPRISEGELRLIIINERPIAVIHKKPNASLEAFSATLFSGAKYTVFSPMVFPKLLGLFESNSSKILERSKLKEFPLLWTADFIPSNESENSAGYILSEINCSCVGIPTQLSGEFEVILAKEAIKKIKDKWYVEKRK